VPFHLNEFIENCQCAIKGAKPESKISALVGEAVAESEPVLAALGRPKRAMIEKLFVSDELTIINVIWAPKMILMPHNHKVWAVIGVYEGREDNIFWRRLKAPNEHKIEAAGAKSIGVGEVASLGKDLIHSVSNPLSAFTSAIHVYGGNFFEIERSEWEPETLTECRYDVVKNMGLFEAENAILKFRETGV